MEVSANSEYLILGVLIGRILLFRILHLSLLSAETPICLHVRVWVAAFAAEAVTGCKVQTVLAL